MVILYLPRVDVYGDDQGIADKEEVEKTSTDRVDKLGKSGVDVEEVKDQNIGWIDVKEIDKLGKDGVDIEENLGTGRVNIEKNLGTNRKDVNKDPGIGGVDKLNTGKIDVKEVEEQLARKQAAAQMLFFSFHKVFYFFFFFLQLKTFDSLFCSSLSLSSITSIKWDDLFSK